MEKAIALLEVQALVASIAGLDAMCKAADVRLIHVEKRLGGRLVTVVVEGTVSAVEAAAKAGAALRVCVATVGDGVNHDVLHTVLGCNLNNADEVVDVGVYAAVGHEAEEVQASTGSLGKSLGDNRVLGQ